MDWRDHGIVLGARRHGESAAIVALFTREHGRHLGLVRGGAGRRAGGLYQKGNLLAVHWRARLAEHLGTFTGELDEPLGAGALDDPARLEALVAALAVLDQALPEREAHTGLYDATLALLRLLAADDKSAAPPSTWAAAYVRWECRCLAEFGFGLVLGGGGSAGESEVSAFVSLRTGRAQGAGALRGESRLPLPPFLAGADGTPPPAADIHAGLALTQHFLDRHVLGPHGRRVPAARLRMLERWRRLATISGK